MLKDASGYEAIPRDFAYAHVSDEDVLALEARTKPLAWIIHENIHRIGLAANGGLAGSQSARWTPKTALQALQPVYRGGCSTRYGQSS